MLATSTAATGTNSNRWPLACSRARSTARSLRQKSFSTRLSAGGCTFHASPAKYVTRSTWQSCGAWKRWYMLEVMRSVA